jgi:hypothetical protein
MPKAGDIVKFLNWTGVVLEVYRGERNPDDVQLKIWFVKNIFQGKSYDLIPYDPDDELGRLQPATLDELKANVTAYLQEVQAQCDRLIGLVRENPIRSQAASETGGLSTRVTGTVSVNEGV